MSCMISEIIRVLSEKDQLGTSIPDSADVPIAGMAVDSRAVRPGVLFVCKGAAFRPEYLAAACEAGAAAYLCEQGEADELAAVAPGAVPIVVRDVRRAMALAAPVVYGQPDEQLQVVGITGTKGKSTTAYMLRSILEAASRPSGLMGSIETDDGIECFESVNTTPEAPELWRHLANVAASGRDAMVMEVSSHGIKYDRVLGLHFDIAAFLNIGRDHISPVEHPDFEDYFASKLRIFEDCGTAVVNLGTAEADRVLAAAQAGAQQVVTCGMEREDARVWADGVEAREGRLRFTVHGAESLGPDAETLDPGRDGSPVEVGISGAFNVENALVAICIARLMGVPMDAIRQGLAHVRVPGRMELVRSTDGRVTAIVDYAHNTLSFQALFESVRNEYPGHRIIALFGAPGGKAHERRQQLPQVAGAYADLIIYTEEDPAHERAQDICAELAANTPAGVQHVEIPDREQAVAHAFDEAFQSEEPTVVLLLAKGDERLQHRGDTFQQAKSDLQLAQELMQRH